MPALLSFPFRPLGNGRAATVEDGSDEHRAEQLTHIALTIRGERILEPAFGLDDPVFVGFDATELAQAAEDFDVDVDDVTVDVDVVDAHREQVTITFE